MQTEDRLDQIFRIQTLNRLGNNFYSIFTALYLLLVLKGSMLGDIFLATMLCHPPTITCLGTSHGRNATRQIVTTQ